MTINSPIKLTLAVIILTIVTNTVFYNNIKYVYLGKAISGLRNVRLTQEQYSDVLESIEIGGKIELIKNVKCFYFYDFPCQIDYLFYLIYVVCLFFLLVNLNKNSSKNDKLL